MSRNLLVISHAFNMDGRAASQTITDKIPFFISKGFKIQVISSVSGFRSKKLYHRQILPWSASGIKFDSRYLFRRFLGTKFLYKLTLLLFSLILLPLIFIEKLFIRLPSHAAWSIPAAISGIFRVKYRKVNVVYTTGGAWSAHLAGYWIWKTTNVPWIVELHDPLIEISKVNSSDLESRLKIWLERKICLNANLVWWFCEGAERTARDRNPKLGGIGFNEFAGANPPIIKENYVKSTKLVFSHFGSLSEGRSLKPFLKDLKRNIDMKNITTQEVELNIYGGNLDSLSKKTIDESGLSSIVREYGRIERDNFESGRSKIMRSMLKSDVMLVMHGQDRNCSEYIPSKFYECLYARRAVLVYEYLNPQFRKLLLDFGCYHRNSNNSGANTLQKIIFDWKDKNLKFTEKVISTENLVNRIIYELEIKKIL